MCRMLVNGGRPEKVMHDNGKQFTSRFFKHMYTIISRINESQIPIHNCKGSSPVMSDQKQSKSNVQGGNVITTGWETNKTNAEPTHPWYFESLFVY